MLILIKKTGGSSPAFIGKGAMPQALQEIMREETIRAAGNIPSFVYFDASQGLDIAALLKTVDKSADKSAEVIAQLSATLTETARTRIEFANSAAGISGKNQAAVQASMIKGLVTEILKDEEIEPGNGYVAINLPTRTESIMQSLKRQRQQLQPSQPGGGKKPAGPVPVGTPPGP